MLLCSKKVVGSVVSRVFACVCWVLSRCSGFFPQSKNIDMRQIGISRLLTNPNPDIISHLGETLVVGKLILVRKVQLDQQSASYLPAYFYLEDCVIDQSINTGV